MKSLGGELASVAATLAIPAAVACLFPYEAASFRATAPTRARPAAAAFVTLNAEEEATAMRLAKASWQSSRNGTQNIRADLSFGELPQAREPAVLDVGLRTHQPRPADMEFAPPPLLPLMAARPTPPMGPEPPVPDEPAFPRDEMLRPGSLGLGPR